MNKDKIKNKKKEMPFGKRIYLTLAAPNMLMAAFIFLASCYVTKIHEADYLKFAVIYVLITIVVEFIFGTITNSIICRNITKELKYEKTTGLSREDRTDLLISVCRFPLLKSFEVYVFFLLCTVMLTSLVSLEVKFSTSDGFTFFFSSLLLSYASGIITHYIVERICSDIAVDLSRKEVDEKRLSERKFFGVSLSKLFFFYIIIPVMVCAVYMLLVCRKNYDGINTDFSRIIFCAIFNILLITMFTIMYFRRINKYTKQMEKALSQINKNEIHKIKELFPVDYSTHISWSFNLINTTIHLFQKLIDNYSTVNNMVQQICQDLTSVSTQTQATVIQQTTSVEEISAAIRNTNQLTVLVENKVDEVINIASKTLVSADENTEELNRNIEKIMEITTENKKTINSIQGLYNKINSIWDIVNMIEGVADQTKIIAFNAELEANLLNSENQRLNSVSMDIRDLADKTTSLTKEIRSQINEIQHSSEQLIVLGRDCMRKIEEAGEYTDKLHNRFTEIKESAALTSKDAEKIKETVSTQFASMKQIENTLGEINDGAKDFSNMTKSIAQIITILQQNSSYIDTISDEYSETAVEQQSLNNKGE